MPSSEPWRIAFKLAQMMKRTLNWYCPLWNLIKEFSWGMLILVASWSMQYSKWLFMDSSLCNDSVQTKIVFVLILSVTTCE